MRRTTQITLTALYLLIFANWILSAPVPTIHALSHLSTLTHPSYDDREAMGINAHHPSSVHISPPSDSVPAYSYAPGRLYASNHHPVGDTVKEKETSYDNRKAAGINAHHTWSKHEFPKAVLAYSYPPRRLHDPKTRKLGRLEAARLAASKVKVEEPCHGDSKPQLPRSSSPESRGGYGKEEGKHLPSSSPDRSHQLPDYDVMPSCDGELPSLWVLMHWKVPNGCNNHSKLFTEDIFEWALWLLGSALVLALGVEVLSMWNDRVEGLMEGTESNSKDEDEGGHQPVDEEIKRFSKPKKTPTSDQLRSRHEKIHLMTSQCKHSQSQMGEGLDIDDGTDENGMEKSSW